MENNYFDFLPIELDEIVLYYIVPNPTENFIEIFDNNIKNKLLKVKEILYEEMFKVEFNELYNDFKQFHKINTFEIVDGFWEISYLELDKKNLNYVKKIKLEYSDNGKFRIIFKFYKIN